METVPFPGPAVVWFAAGVLAPPAVLFAGCVAFPPVLTVAFEVDGAVAFDPDGIVSFPEAGSVVDVPFPPETVPLPEGDPVEGLVPLLAGPAAVELEGVVVWLALVPALLGVAAVLLASAGIVMLRSFGAVTGVKLGFEPV